MTRILCIAAGGAIGAVTRHSVNAMAVKWAGTGFPWGTMCVNLVGCLLIGLLAGLFETFATSQHVKMLVLTGFLGAFTTFSTFGLETAGLFRKGHGMLAMGNVIGSCVAGLCLVFIGLAAARLIADLVK